VDNVCYFLVTTSYCCGTYPNYQAENFCLITEMKDPRVRSRILELSQEAEILVPTCHGAYVPARIAFHLTTQDKESKVGGF
jgi:hypothetical protein